MQTRDIGFLPLIIDSKPGKGLDINKGSISVCKWALVSDPTINESAADRAALFAEYTWLHCNFPFQEGRIKYQVKSNFH